MVNDSAIRNKKDFKKRLLFKPYRDNILYVAYGAITSK